MWERDALMHQLAVPPAGGSAVLSCAKVLAEGVDVPALDGVVIADPRQSVVEMVQVIGRVLRSYPGKTTGTIIVPVLVSPDERSAGPAMREAGYQTLHQVLMSLRAHDEDMEGALRAGERSLEEGVLPDFPDNIEMDLPVGVQAGLAAALKIKLIEQTAGRRLWIPRAIRCECGSETCADAQTAREATAMMSV